MANRKFSKESIQLGVLSVIYPNDEAIMTNEFIEGLVIKAYDTFILKLNEFVQHISSKYIPKNLYQKFDVSVSFDAKKDNEVLNTVSSMRVKATIANCVKYNDAFIILKSALKELNADVELDSINIVKADSTTKIVVNFVFSLSKDFDI